jgi:hypothetical protein
VNCPKAGTSPTNPSPNRNLLICSMRTARVLGCALCPLQCNKPLTGRNDGL